MNDKVMTAAANVTSYGVVNLYNKGLFVQKRKKPKRTNSVNPYARRRHKLYDVGHNPKDSNPNSFKGEKIKRAK